MFALIGDCWGHEGSGNRYFLKYLLKHKNASGNSMGK